MNNALLIDVVEPLGVDQLGKLEDRDDPDILLEVCRALRCFFSCLGAELEAV